MRFAVAAALILTLAAPGAWGQTAVKAKRRPQAPPVAASTSVPSLAPRPGVSTAFAGGRSGGLAAGGLAQAGLRTGGDGGAVCRAGCARNRYSCELTEDGCAPQWAACVKSCADPGGGSGGALLPRQ